jgi:cytochrome c oxidase subunit 1
LLLSIPTGFHHQYTDPGIGAGMKTVHAVLTFGVVFPSFATAFSVIAALEMGGRARGGRGLLGWIRTLPWSDPSVTAQLLAMLTFVLGGMSGLINASAMMNQVIHNTTWVPGHFHLTVGTAVALSFMGIAYWLVPYLTGRGLWSRGIALASSWLYTIGTLIFSRGMISAGLAGLPRRIFRVEASYDSPAWDLGGNLTAIGGTLMFFGIMLFFVDVAMTIAAGRRGEAPRDVPISAVLSPAPAGGSARHLDRLGLWVVAAILLIALAYGPFLLSYAPRFVSPGFRLF